MFYVSLISNGRVRRSERAGRWVSDMLAVVFRWWTLLTGFMSEMPVLYRAMTTPHCQQRHTSRPPVWGRKRKVKRVPGLCPATMIVNIPTVGEREREKGYKQQSETAGPEFTFRRRPRRSVVVCSTRRTGIFIPKLARNRKTWKNMVGRFHDGDKACPSGPALSFLNSFAMPDLRVFGP